MANPISAGRMTNPRWLLPLAVCLSCTLCGAHPNLPQEFAIPSVARIAGIRVGIDTISDLEDRLGPGAILTGGHPQGARLWKVRNGQCCLYADGFELRERSSDSYVIDRIRITRKHPDCRPSRLHVCAIPPHGLTILGRVRLGMTRAEVLSALRSYHPLLLAKPDRVRLTGFGHVRPNESTEYRIWKADIFLIHDHVASFDVFCS